MKTVGIFLLVLFATSHADLSINDEPCGGTMVSDIEQFYFAQNPTTSTDQICIWTLHLETMNKMRIYVNIDIAGNDVECTAGSLGLYALNNALPGGVEGVKLCNENIGDGYRYFDTKVLTVVFKVNERMNGSDYDFRLVWEGQEDQITPVTKHISTFSTSSSGIVKYPIEGEYEPNSIYTWVVQSHLPLLTSSIDINVNNVSVEKCFLQDPCYCDAFMIYSVTPWGAVTLVDKFCGDRVGTELQLVFGNSFITVLYSDRVDEPGAGFGYEMIWKEGPEQSTTTTTTSTTTTPETTTKDPNVPTIKTCGGILEAEFGIVEYKLDEDYGNSERCAWIIRNPQAKGGLHVRKIRSGFEIGSDYLSIFTFTYYESESSTMGKTTNDEESRVFNYASMAVIVFTSNAVQIGQGFQLEFLFNGTGYAKPNYTDFFSSDEMGSFSMGGPDATDHYENDQLSVFVMSRNNTYYSDIGWEARLHIYKIDETPVLLDPCYYEGIRVYSVALDSLSFVGKYCSNSDVNLGPFLARNLYIFVFVTDYSGNNGGFQIDWKPR